MRNPQPAVVDLAELERLHKFHLAEAQRYADCLALIGGLAKRRKAVDGMVDAVRGMAAASSPLPKQNEDRTRSAERERRERSAVLLERFVADEPRPLPLDVDARSRQASGALMRSGYLKKRGDGYVRTRKQFIVGRIKHADSSRGPGRPRKAEHERTSKSKYEYGRIDRERRAAGVRPIDHVRRLLAGGEPVTRATIAAAVANGGTFTPAQQARVSALVLKALTARREIKESADGFTATPKLVRALLDSNRNGNGDAAHVQQ